MLIDRVHELPPDQRIIIAYDGMSLDQAVAMHTAFNNAGYYPIAKVNSLATRPGLDAVMARFGALGSAVMFDPKHHDANNTMYDHIAEDAAASPTAPFMVTIHVSNSTEALGEAVRARNEKVGEGATAESKFVEFAYRAKEARLQGLVSSGRELVVGYEFRELDGLLRVVPGIKLPKGADTAGQKRLYTPDRAIGDGAHFVVIGRAITEAAEPVAALEQAVRLVTEAA